MEMYSTWKLLNSQDLVTSHSSTPNTLELKKEKKEPKKWFGVEL